MYKEHAYAKVNLYLDVLGKRADGYHDIASLFQSTTLYDELSAEIIPGGHITIDYVTAVDFAMEEDLIYKAAVALQSYSVKCGQEKQGVKILLNKALPTGAGLGGGSADAAAVLRLLNRLWNLGYSAEILESVGAPLGADIPFCIQGGSAIAEGIGEKLTHIDDLPKRYLAVLTPNDWVGTAEAYGKLTPSGYEKWPVVKQQMVRNGEYPLFNKFEESVFPGHPAIREVADQLKQQKNIQGVLLSGSGASVFGLFEGEIDASQAVENLKKHCRYAEVACFKEKILI